MASAVVHRQLSTKERKILVRIGIRNHPDWTDNRIAILYGLTQDTVSRVSDEMVADGKIPTRPTTRIDASGREIDVAKLKKKAKKEGGKPSHPLLSLVTAWHEARGGHPTTSAQLVSIADAANIDLVELGLCQGGHTGSKRLKNVTSRLRGENGKCIGKFILAVYRHPDSGLTLFSLVRSQDYRPNIN